MRQEEYKNLSEQIRQLTQRTEAAARAETEAAVRRAVSDAAQTYSFRDRLSKCDFVKLVADCIRVDDEGEMSGPDGSSIEELIQAEYRKRPLWHGTPTQSATPTVGSAPEFDLNEWDESAGHLSPDRIDALQKAIAAAMPKTRSERR